jgi:hypothetical protein
MRKRLGPAVVLAAGPASVVGMMWLAQAHPVRAAAALLAVYLLGYVAGSLLVDSRDDPAAVSWAMIRTIAGLLLTTIAFFVSLVLSLPWFSGPAGVLLCAVLVERRAAFQLPRPRFRFRRGGVVTGALAAVVLSPIVISAIRMAPGDFPPVFYNVDTPYFLEKVHALVNTSTYPPESLSNDGGRPFYHFGIHGITALISRSSTLAPHHSLFLIVLPLLTGGVLAAAVAAAQGLSPALPSAVSVPLLLISVPSFWYSFWNSVGPPLWTAAASPSFVPLDTISQNYELWGVASIVGHNIGAQFVVLATLAALVAAPSRGWRLPVLLTGSAVIVKASTGIALVAGFLLAQVWRSIAARRLRLLTPALAVAVLFAAAYAAFLSAPTSPAAFRTEPFPLFHLNTLIERGALHGFGLDLAWLFLPALMVSLARIADPEKPSLSLLLLGIAPFIVVNVTRSIDARPGGGGVTDDWLQILLPATFLLHAFVLSAVSRRWTRLGTGLRAAFVLVMALTILPPVFVAARYALVLIRDPERGHEFVDNRSLGEALAAVPTRGSIVVTNDLRYPAQEFDRDNRQMQIPALFGHQAFAVNYAYEKYEFSSERRELQTLLQAPDWSAAIEESARTHRWTHLLIRKDYAHPAPIPLAPVFENELYAVFRFGPAETVRRDPESPQ